MKKLPNFSVYLVFKSGRRLHIPGIQSYNGPVRPVKFQGARRKKLVFNDSLARLTINLVPFSLLFGIRFENIFLLFIVKGEK